MVPDCFNDFGKALVRNLCGCEEVSDKLVRRSSDDTKKYCSLFVRCVDIICDEILLESFNIRLPGFLCVLKLSDIPMVSHIHRSILVLDG